MRLGYYTFEQRPRKGWGPVVRRPRVRTTPTLGGSRVAVLGGDIADEVVVLPFSDLNATPGKTQIRTYAATDDVADTITAGEMLAYKIPVEAGSFAAISAARLTLKQTGMAGELRVEVWDTDGGLPNERVGLLGVLTANDIGAAFADVDIFADCAWPIGATEGWLVLNGAAVTGGTISCAGEVVAPNAHAKYELNGTWAWGLANGELSGTVWQGGQCLVLRGLVGAYGSRGLSLEADLDDGQLYDAVPVAFGLQWDFPPLTLSDEAYATGARLDLVLTGER